MFANSCLFYSISIKQNCFDQLMWNPNFQLMLVVVWVPNFLCVVLVVHEEGVMGALVIMLPYNL
jgi:hypothetical protein